MSLSTVITMGYEIGSMGLVTTLGYGQGAAPPPPPPVITTSVYGPALTEWERKRWFADFDSPEERKRKKKELETARRIEAGIIKELIVPKEIRAEVKEVIKEAVRAEVLTPQIDELAIVGKLAYEVAQELVLSLRDDRRLRKITEIEELRIQEEQEEDEAMEAMTLFMLQ